MSLLLLSLAAASVPQALLDRADSANQAFVECLFAVSRTASAQQLSAQGFDARIEGACQAEERALVEAGAKVLTARGEQSTQAKAARAASDARQMVRQQYHRFGSKP